MSQSKVLIHCLLCIKILALGLLGYPPFVEMVPEEGALGHREAVAGREEELLANVDALRI